MLEIFARGHSFPRRAAKFSVGPRDVQQQMTLWGDWEYG